MSLYSIDSLENEPAYPPNSIVDSEVELSSNNIRLNLKTSKTYNNSSHKQQPHFNPPLPHVKNTNSNETTESNRSPCPTENSITTNNRIPRAKNRNPSSKKDAFAPATATKCEKDAMSRSIQEKTRISSRFVPIRLPEVTSKLSLSRNEVLNTAASVVEEPMKPNKKLGNVLAPAVKECKKSVSYLGLYHRRFKVPSERLIRSPEGSTLSICGDNEIEQLTDDDSRELSASYRDDESELSFYRHWIKQPLQEPPTTRSCETIRRSFHSFPPIADVRSVSEHKLNSAKIPSYRPYTIEDYRTLPAPRADRSLGPDKVEMQAKREWLMRRRSYGDLVSARNRQNIILQMQKLKSKRAREGLLPPLQNGATVSKIESIEGERNVRSEDASNTQNRKKRLKRPARLFRIRKTTSIMTSTSEEFKSAESSTSFRSPVKSYESLEDSHLEYLKQRHLDEKKMLDSLLKRTMLS